MTKRCKKFKKSVNRKAMTLNERDWDAYWCRTFKRIDEAGKKANDLTYSESIDDRVKGRSELLSILDAVVIMHKAEQKRIVRDFWKDILDDIKTTWKQAWEETSE